MANEGKLCHLYDKWIKWQGFKPVWSADDLIADLFERGYDMKENSVIRARTDYQIKWLEKFSSIWEKYVDGKGN